MRHLPRVVRLRMAFAVGFLWALIESNRIAWAVGRDRGVWDAESVTRHRWLLVRWHESQSTRAQIHSIDQFFKLV